MGIIVGVIGVGLGVASLIFDLGWPAWVLALLSLGAAVILALSGSLASAVVGLVAAGAIVAAGIFAVSAPPPLPESWTVLPEFTPDDGGDTVYEIGRNDEVLVTIDHGKKALAAHSLGGEPVWTNEQANAGDDRRSAVFAGGSVVTYSQRAESGPAISVSTESGETEWSTDVGGAEPFTASDDVIVFSGDDRTFALDRQTGDHVWELAAQARASSEGASGFNPAQWSAGRDWIVVQDTEPGEYHVVDTRTGDLVADFGEGHPFQEWAIAGDTLIVMDFDDSGRRVARGTPLAGGDGWTTRITDFNGNARYDAVGDDLRIVADSYVEWLDSGSGRLTTLALPTGWTLASVYSGIDGARSLVAEHREPDYRLVGAGVFDSIRGELTEIEGPFDLEPSVEGATPTGTLVWLPYRDAVGGEHNRLVLIPDGHD